MRFIDTHTHLYEEAFDDDREVVIQRSIESGVDSWILPAIDSTYFQAHLSLWEKYKDRGAYMGMGLHPTSVGKNWKEELQFAIDQLTTYQDRYIAVGEIGLDAYWSKEFMKEQAEVLATQLDYAAQKGLPVIIHERNATEQMFDIIKAYKGRLTGVFHAFTGSIETYERISALGGFKVGIGGVVTFKNAGIAGVVADIPLQDIVLETDSPYLTPAPFRGKRNESSYIRFIAEKIAQIKDLSLEEVAEATCMAAKSVFKNLQ